MNLLEIIRHFQINGEPEYYEEIGAGLINSTYKVKTNEALFTLQKVNHSVFQDPEALSRNIVFVTGYLKALKLDFPEMKIPEPVLTNTNNACFQDAEDEFWRVFKFIPGRTFEKPQNEIMTAELGRIFGQFHAMLQDFPLKKLNTILPDFHNTEKRLHSLKKRVNENAFNRVEESKEEIQFLLESEKELASVLDIFGKNELPIRLVHQDAKLSNVLFDESKRAIAIIDLDTLGSGFVAYDFGDIVRSAMNTGNEDDENTEAVNVEMDYFKAFVNAYAKEAKSFLKMSEVNSLVPGALMICYEQAVRFLDDFLNGDQYFKIEKEKHNLIRARNQIAYLKKLMSKKALMQKLVENAFKLN